MTEWMTIESAPKDGTRFVAYEDGYGWQECSWDKGHDGDRGGFRNAHHGWSPTHWLNVPEPPK